MSKICFARVDRIGDLILTLPCEKLWKKMRPTDDIVWLVPENLRFVIESVTPKTKALYVKNVKTFADKLAEIRHLAGILRGEKIEKIVAIHVPWWIAAAIFFSRIEKRIGTASQWFSWIFFNRRLRQKRSQAVKHESQYNFDLINFALNDVGAENLSLDEIGPTKIEPAISRAHQWKSKLKEIGLEEKRFVVIHPGMAGSARNWPAPNYKKLAQELLSKNVPVVITGSSIDSNFVKKTGLLNLPGIKNLTDQTSGEDLIALLSLAGVVVAPSTGVAHLSSSLGVRLAGIYCPVKVQAPQRWKPLGPRTKVFVPHVDCPGVHSCLGPACPHFDCMEQIPVETVAAYVMDNL